MNKKIFLKLGVLALAALMLLPCFVACNTTTPPATPQDTTPKDTTSEETTPAETEPPIVNNYESKAYRIEENLDLVKISGRYTLPGEGVAVNWSAAGIEFNADCEGDVTVRIGSTNTAIYGVYVDGQKTKTISISANTKNYTVASNLERGVHNVRLVKLTDAESVDTFIRITVKGLLEEKPADKKYYVEFIGDSITCGYGLGEGQTNDASQSWAFLLAEKIDADYSFVSIGGIGVAASTDRHSGKVMSDLYPYVHKGSDVKYETERKADIVFIGLNTNDNGRTSQFTKAQYLEKAQSIIDTVKKIHGDDVKIVWVSTLMFSAGTCDSYAFELFYKTLGSENKGYYFVYAIPDSSGLNSHPSAAGQLANAEKVAKFVKDKKLFS